MSEMFHLWMYVACWRRKIFEKITRIPAESNDRLLSLQAHLPSILAFVNYFLWVHMSLPFAVELLHGKSS